MTVYVPVIVELHVDDDPGHVLRLVHQREDPLRPAAPLPRTALALQRHLQPVLSLRHS